MPEKRCYFAHHVTDYNTQREKTAIEVIENYGFVVENPNSTEHNANYKERGMQYFVDLVAECEALAFQRFPEGQIGAGVAKEIGAAAIGGLSIFEVADDVLTEVDLIKSVFLNAIGPILSVDETRSLIKSIRENKQP